MTNFIMSFIGALLGSSITIILFGYYIFKTDFSNETNEKLQKSPFRKMEKLDEDEFGRNKFINWNGILNEWISCFLRKVKNG